MTGSFNSLSSSEIASSAVSKGWYASYRVRLDSFWIFLFDSSIDSSSRKSSLWYLSDVLGKATSFPKTLALSVISEVVNYS